MTEPSDYQRPAGWPSLDEPDEAAPGNAAGSPPRDALSGPGWAPPDRLSAADPAALESPSSSAAPVWDSQFPDSAPLDWDSPPATAAPEWDPPTTTPALPGQDSPSTSPAPPDWGSAPATAAPNWSQPPPAPAPPDWGSPPAAAAPDWRQPSAAPSWLAPPKPPGWRGPRLVRTPRLGLALGLLAGALGLLLIVPNLLPTTSGPRPTAARSYSPPPEPLGTAWVTKAGQVRTDLPGAEFVGGLDGSMDGGYVADLTTAWLALTGTEDDRRVAVHALDPATGSQLWTRPLEQGLCATETLPDGAVCAEALRVDPATGMGTRWRLMVLDARTGTVTRSTELDGWFTLLHVHRGRIVLVEQRQPAPHAVVRFLDERLAGSRTLDLSAQPQHVRLFSDDRIIYRHFPIPDGPALDRPRFRQVADGLLALWSGAGTALLDPARGALVALLHCSRLVDDGERLWCNAGDQAVAYDYRGRRLHETALGVRLAFPVRDPQAGDVTDPVFIDSQGVARLGDLATGKTVGTLAPTSNGSVWGMTIEPRATFTKGRTLISDHKRTFAVDVRSGRELWRSDEFETNGQALTRGDDLLVLDSEIRRVDAGTGRVLGSYSQRVGLYTGVLGNVLVGSGPEEIGRLVDP